MKSVGLAGIIKLTTLIICRNSKHFLCVALVIALPAALNLLLLDASGSNKLVLGSISYMYKLLFPDEDGNRLPPPVDPSSAAASDKNQFHIALARIVVSAVSLVIYVVYTPLLTFSVCRACLGMSVLDLEGSAKALRRSAGNLFLTILCLLAVLFVVSMAVAVVTVAAAAIVGGGSTAGVVIIIVVGAIASAGIVYLVVVLSLAKTVAILEDCWGWEAMKRSIYLVGQQRKGTALALMLLFGVCGLLLLLSGMASDSRWIAVAVGVGAVSLVEMASMVSIVVLYMSCRAGLGEPLHSIVAADDQFNSSQLPAKYLDPETATSLATSQI